MTFLWGGLLFNKYSGKYMFSERRVGCKTIAISDIVTDAGLDHMEVQNVKMIFVAPITQQLTNLRCGENLHYREKE